MGRMKELYMEIIHANQGIPEEMSISDMLQMEKLKIYQWENYEREQEKIRLFNLEQENPGEIAKIQETREQWESCLKKRKKKNK